MSEREDSTAGPAPTAPVGSSGGASAVPGDVVPGFGPTTPEYSTGPVVLRRPDVLAALLLLLAGLAAALSLPLRWLREDGTTGWGLVRRGLEILRESVGQLIDTGFWQPVAVVFGGAVLLVLGLLLLLPARSHRTLGVVALLVTAVVVAAVLVPLFRADGGASDFGPGFWCATAVAVLGLLGSLKAALTGRRAS